jgi:tetratricopeptide (TPR) repeat protein
VARDHELEILRQRWELAREGEGQMVYVRGEAGLGKTRLVEEFTDEVTKTPMMWLKCRCSPYHQNTELYPLIDLFRRTLRFTNPEQESGAAERLEALVRSMDMPVETVVPLLSALLSLPLGPGYQPVNLSPEGRKKNTLAAVLELILRQAERQPVLMIVEDLHWIDASTLGFLDLLVETQAAARILTVLTFRPEFDPPWRQLSYLSEVSLRRLGSKEAHALVTLLANGKSLPPDVLEDIVAKADGIPLFAEELTKMVTESDHSAASGKKLAVPATLEGSLIARLDRLDTAKEVAQVASVIGRDFFRGLLSQAVSVEETALVRDLERLLQSEIILRRGLPSDATYFFKHALIQQAAYESILGRDARQLHGRIAELLVSRFPELAERQPEVAAFHFTRAGLTEKAIDYWQRAAERSIKNSANPEAVAHLSKCLELLADLPEGKERDRREMRLRTALALPLIATKGYAAVEVDEALSRARQLCTEVGDDAELFRVLRLLWSFETVRGDHAKAFEAAQQILVMAKSEGAAALRLEADRVLGSSYFYMGRMAEARQHFESAIDLYDRKRDHGHVLVYGQDPGVSCLANQTLTLWFMGYPDQAQARGAEAVSLARELGHPYSLCYSLFFCGWQYVFLRDFDKVHECIEEAIQVSRHQSFPFWETMGMITSGWLNAQRGEPAAGLAMMTEWLAKSRRLGARLYFPTFHCLMTEIHAAQGDVEAGLATVEEGLAIRHATGESFCEPELYRLKGDLLAMQAPGSPAAEECLIRARDTAAAQGSKSLELRAAMSLSRFWSANGKEEAARGLIEGARRWFTEGDGTHDLRKADALRAELGLVSR